jgi:RNA polymerase sigma-70 factor (ECF subfamily)
MAASLAIRAGSFRVPTTIMHSVQLPEATDGQLIVRIAGGDRGAFDELHGRYSRAVLGLALRRLGDRGRAEDATQDAFVAIWRSARTYDPARGRGAPWLYAVARNAITDGLRRTPEPVAELEDGPGREPDPADEAEAAWTAWRVHRALEVLPEHERPVIELAYWSGLSQSEIADRLAIPLGTVKTRTRSALARLADTLDEELR